MIIKIDNTPQLNMYRVPLKQFIRENLELVILSRKIDWDYNELRKYYCLDNGRAGIPIRKIAGILMLKRMFKVSDESVLARWFKNPYWQYFCGKVNFQHNLPFDRTELIKFRHRIGEEGAEKILKASIDLYCSKEVKEILSQERFSKDNIYSIHKPHVKYIIKVTEAKKYEYGNKVYIAKTKKSGIIVEALLLIDNVYRGEIPESQLLQIKKVAGGHKPQTGIVVRDFRDRNWVNGTQIVILGKLPASATNYRKQKIRKQFRARAGIKPVIGHLKHEHRMNRNYLSGNLYDTVNVLLAAAGFNMRRMLLRIRKELKKYFVTNYKLNISCQKILPFFSC